MRTRLRCRRLAAILFMPADRVVLTGHPSASMRRSPTAGDQVTLAPACLALAWIIRRADISTAHSRILQVKGSEGFCITSARLCLPLLNARPRRSRDGRRATVGVPAPPTASAAALSAIAVRRKYAEARARISPPPSPLASASALAAGFFARRRTADGMFGARRRAPPRRRAPAPPRPAISTAAICLATARIKCGAHGAADSLARAFRATLYSAARWRRLIRNSGNDRLGLSPCRRRLDACSGNRIDRGMTAVDTAGAGTGRRLQKCRGPFMATFPPTRLGDAVWRYATDRSS